MELLQETFHGQLGHQHAPWTAFSLPSLNASVSRGSHTASCPVGTTPWSASYLYYQDFAYLCVDHAPC
ncbi:hypothetical protein HanIR_Chr09g0391921 [Helianthus annuus]|nr:hypothetical protein HanIR_Chr09g0391921 [Helianthus annuus]